MTPTPQIPAPSNWKTTLLGLLALIVSVGSIWVPSKYQPQIQATGGLLAGSGLIMASDARKAGQ